MLHYLSSIVKDYGNGKSDKKSARLSGIKRNFHFHFYFLFQVTLSRMHNIAYDTASFLDIVILLIKLQAGKHCKMILLTTYIQHQMQAKPFIHKVLKFHFSTCLDIAAVLLLFEECFLTRYCHMTLFLFQAIPSRFRNVLILSLLVLCSD